LRAHGVTCYMNGRPLGAPGVFWWRLL
jgi:hypothetical protein